MGSSKKIAKGVFWTTLLNLINGIYGFISVPLLIVYFGKADYGLIGLAISINIYLRLMDLGFNSTNVRFFSNWLAQKELENVKKLFQTSLAFYGCIGLLNAFILYGIACFSEQLFHLGSGQDIILKHLLHILAISAIISWFTSCFDQLIKAHEYIGWVQKVLILPKLAQLLILGLTIWCRFTIEGYYALTVFSMFIALPLIVYKIKQIAPYISFWPKFDWLILKRILPYSINIFSFGIFQFSINYLRPVFLGIRGSIDNVADYRILNGIIAVVLMLGGAFVGVILPSASKVVALGNRAAQDKIAYDGTKYITIALCLCCFGIMSVSKELLVLYVGESYLYLSFWLDVWLLTTLVAHNQAISSLILSGSDIRAITYSTIVASVVGLLFCWFLIPHYKVGGTVIAYGVYGFIQIMFYYFYYWPKKMGINSFRIFKTSLFPCVTIGITAMCIAQNSIRFIMADSSVLYRFIVQGFTFLSIYAVLTYCFTLNQNDKAFFLRIIRKKD